VQVSGRTFLVTGGASGLGAATARRLAAAGGNVVICDIGAEQGKKLAAELGQRASFLVTDVTDESQVAKAVAAAREKFAALVEHIIVNPMLNGEVIRLDGALRMSAK